MNDDIRTALVERMVDDLTNKGFSLFKTTEDKNLVVMRQDLIGLDKHQIMVSLEGGGCLFWDRQRELNPFRLINAGFDGATSATLSEVLNSVNRSMV